MTHRFNYKRGLLPALGALLLGQTALADIYRPLDTTALIAAVNSANSSSGDDIIDLQGRIFKFSISCGEILPTPPADCASVNGPNALPVVTSNSGKLSIINGRIERDSTTGSPFRLIEVASGANLTLFNVTLENGYLVLIGNQMVSALPKDFPGILSNQDNGGAIFNAGALVLQNSTLYNNTALDLGGAIYNAPGASLDIQSSDIINNTAFNFFAGIGGGGGIFNAVEALINSIDNSNISNNNTPGFGAGINNQGAARNIFSTTIANNYCCTTVDGGTCPDGEPTASGGGIYNANTAQLLQLINVTIANNVAYQGGGIYNNSAGFLPLTRDDIPSPSFGTYIYNSTIAYNEASQGGGGIYNNNNDGNDNVATIEELVSTIIAGNIDTQEISLATPDIQNFDGTPEPALIYVALNNLIGNNAGVTSITALDNNMGPIRFDNIVGTTVSPINPLLKSLDYNGGFTQTIAIQPGSPAKDNGLNPYRLIYDQREKPYRRVACSLPDIGAYELQNCFLQE